MIKHNIKYVFWVVLFFLTFILFNAWKNEKYLVDDLDSEKKLHSKMDFTNNISEFNFKDCESFTEDIVIKTNLIEARINPSTGDFSYIALKEYFKDVGGADNVVIFNKSDDRFYFSQTGIIGAQFLEKKYLDNSILQKLSYDVKNNSSNMFIVLKYEYNHNIFVYKVYTFKTYSYEIILDTYVKNNSDMEFSFKYYGLIKYKYDNLDKSFFNSGLRAYEGWAVYTDNKPYKKISFDEVSNKSFSYSGVGGWMAFLERYFISALIPDNFNNYVYIAEKNLNNIYSFKYLSKDDIILKSDECVCLSTSLFIGPKTTKFLNNLSKGLELTIDYGIFWPIASPIFFLLNFIYSFVSNWGIAIILVTLVIKLLFFNLSSISYKSMGNMKKLQPRLDLLKEQYKDDKTQFGNAIINLYKKENINPLSGCLPILIQIPVFISLYYVILESIELRHAPFFYWIYDLSSKDPYYIFPILMSITMFIQQKLNPPIQDQFQAKVMMFLPVVFLFIFLQFPSGLILYWIVNNILSILQQWIMTRK